MGKDFNRFQNKKNNPSPRFAMYAIAAVTVVYIIVRVVLHLKAGE